MVFDAPAFGAMRGDEKKKAVAIKEFLWLVEGLGRPERGVGEGHGVFSWQGFYIPLGIPLKLVGVYGLNRSWRDSPFCLIPRQARLFGLPRTKMDNSVAEREGFEQ